MVNDMTMVKIELTENKRNELKRVFEILNRLGKGITKNNILLYADQRIISGKWLTSMPKKELLAEVMREPEVNSTPKKKISPEVIRLAREKHEACFNAFVKLIDEMVEAGVSLSDANIRELKDDSFNNWYWHQNEKAKEYIKEARTKTNYKPQMGRKKSEKTTSNSGRFSETDVFVVKTLDDYDITYLKDVINYLYDENNMENITPERIIDAIPEFTGFVVSENQIKTCSSIMQYIAFVNGVIERNMTYNTVKKTIEKMEKEGVLINRYTVINRMRGTVPYEQFKTHPELDTLIENAVSIKTPEYVY